LSLDEDSAYSVLSQQFEIRNRGMGGPTLKLDRGELVEPDWRLHYCIPGARLSLNKQKPNTEEKNATPRGK
jgi:hypothetical protein